MLTGERGGGCQGETYLFLFQRKQRLTISLEFVSIYKNKNIRCFDHIEILE